MSEKRKVLTLEERVNVLKLIDQGKSARAVALEIGVGKTQIGQIVKRKAEIMEDFESNMPGNSKRKRRKTGNEEVNELTWAWFKEAMTRRVNVNGPLIQQRALEFAKDLGNETFKASNGWLISFLKRNNIVLGTMSGERGDVDNNVVKEWIDKVPSLCAGYESCNIFNMDETGLFYRDTTRQTYHIKGDECAGGKRSKERVTLALCASLTGEKLPPLFIGKSKKPRCFNSIKPESLPVIYKNNKKAWMNSALFEEWLRALDKKMKQQKRKIILFLDNAPCHPKLSLQNVKLQFFPPNTTCKVQPMERPIKVLPPSGRLIQY